MSWFSTSLSLSIPSSPNQDKDNDKEDEKVDAVGNVSQPLAAGKGVKEDISELTKSLTRQLWGVATFLAPPPSSKEESPKHTNAPQTETHAPTIGGDIEDHQALVVDATEGKKAMGGTSEVAASAAGSPSKGGRGVIGEMSDSPRTESSSAAGSRLIGFRSDLAELRGTMATGLSRIQTVIRAVTQEEDEDEEGDVVGTSPVGSSDSGDAESTVDEAPQNKGLNSLLKPLLGRVSSFRENMPRIDRRNDTALVSAEHGEQDQEHAIPSKDLRPSAFTSGIGGLSKLATSFIPYARDIVGDLSRKDYYAVGLTDEVVAFANNIAVHPETWLDFPLSEEEDVDDFVMTEAQQEHAEAVKQVAFRLAAVYQELCPAIISDSRFWKIYFVLLHSRLSKEDAELLSTPQVLGTREALVQHLQKKEPVLIDTPPTRSEREELGLTEISVPDTLKKHVVLKEQLESTAEFKPSSSRQAVSPSGVEIPLDGLLTEATIKESKSEPSSSHFAALRLEDDEVELNAWLEDEADDGIEAADSSGIQGAASHEIPDAESAVTVEEDVTFSDLEDDDNECNQGEDGGRTTTSDSKVPKSGVSLTVPEVSLDDESVRSKSDRGEFNDWLTVNEEDAVSAGSSSP